MEHRSRDPFVEFGRSTTWIVYDPNNDTQNLTISHRTFSKEPPNQSINHAIAIIIKTRINNTDRIRACFCGIREKHNMNSIRSHQRHTKSHNNHPTVSFLKNHSINQSIMSSPSTTTTTKKMMSLHYWAGRGLMEVPRMCLAIKGKFPDSDYEDLR